MVWCLLNFWAGVVNSQVERSVAETARKAVRLHRLNALNQMGSDTQQLGGRSPATKVQEDQAGRCKESIGAQECAGTATPPACIPPMDCKSQGILITHTFPIT